MFLNRWLGVTLQSLVDKLIALKFELVACALSLGPQQLLVWDGAEESATSATYT